MECANHLNGSICEGFVGRDRNFNRVKIKSANYVSLHHNVKHSVVDLIRIVISNEEKEVGIYFPEVRREKIKMLPLIFV